MKKKISFIIILFMALTGSYLCATNTTSSPEDTMPKFLAKPSNQTVPLGGTIRVEGIVIGTPTPEVRFYKNNIRIYADSRISISFDGERASLRITNATLDDTGIYKIKAENPIGMSEASCEITVEKKQ